MAAPNIPDFRLIKPIGEGGVGEIWMGLDLLENYRAIKIIRQNQFKRLEDYQAEFHGIRKYAPLSQNHAGLIEIHHAGIRDEEGFYYYIMSLADDLEHGVDVNPYNYHPKTLRTYLDSLEGRVPLEEAKQIALEITSALDELHSKGLVHRDIKPDNILCVEGRWELGDIGFVSDVGSRTQVGTIGYLAPEGPGKPAADILSLGKVLYEISTGNDVSDFPDYPSWVFDSPDDRENFQEFNNIILKASDPIADNRFKNAAELLDDLLKITHQKTDPQKEPEIESRSPVIYSFVLVLIIGFVWYFVHQITNTLEPEPMAKEKISKALPTKPTDEETPSNTKPNTQEFKEAIEAAIRLSIKKPTGELTSADIENVRIIDLRSKQLTDLRFLAKLTQLESLMLFDSGIEDVSPLQGLRRLTYLNLHSNRISDISSLSGLTGLKQLFLDDNKLIYINPLKELKQLEELSLAFNSISDVSALKELKQLRLLNLRDNPSLSKANIAKLQKELPMCRITHNATTMALPSINLPSNLSQGLIAYYPFNRNAQDESGNGHHAKIYEKVSLGKDRHSKAESAYYFDGQLGYMKLPIKAMENTGDACTISLWVNPLDRSPNSTGVIFAASSGGPSNRRYIDFQRGGQIQGRLGNPALVIAKGPIEPNEWHHVILLWRNNNSDAEMFLNGKSIGKNPKQYWLKPSLKPGDIWVGGWTKRSKSAIDDIRIYNRALSYEEVESLYKAEKP